MHFSHLASVLSASLVLLATACGGLTSPGQVDSDPGPGGDAQSGGEGKGGSTGDGACHAYATSGQRACTPGLAAAGTPIQIEVEVDECSFADTCKVQVDGAQINLALSASGCPAGTGGSSEETTVPMCTSVKVACRLPALEAGTYLVEIVGQPARPRFPARRELEVAAGGESSCTLDGAPAPAAPYATACEVDEDCMLVLTGDACQPCSCESGVIAGSEWPRYKAARRTALSQCRPTREGDYGCEQCPGHVSACRSGACVMFPR
jgi:hypothetical protein